MSPVTPPPRGLAWVVGPFGRLLSFTLAVAALAVSMYVGYRYVGLVDCLSERDAADQRRTAAIARATDAERAADLALLRGAGTSDVAALRVAATAARENTDAIRRAYPAPRVEPCH
jgi:hypothetical protein